MSDYTKNTDFAAKDALATGDPNKLIKGADFATEFDSLEVAVNSKADSADASLTGTTSFENLSDGTNTATGFSADGTMVADSDSLIPTQKAVKTYVDAAANFALVSDPSPTLGASLDLGGYSVTGTGSMNIDGNVNTTGSINGRDTITDGSKLDSIEAGATGDQTATEIKVLVDAALDSNVFTDAAKTKLDGIADGADVTGTANVQTAGALMDSEVTNLDQVKTFDKDEYATAAQGLTADSALQAVADDLNPQLGSDLDVNGSSIVSASDGDINITPDGTGSVVIDGLSYPSTDGTAGQVIATDGAGNLTFADGGTGGGTYELDISTDSGTGSITDAETLVLFGGEGINTAMANNTVVFSGNHATTTSKGIASFDAGDFNVVSGVVTLTGAGGGAGIAHVVEDTDPALGGDLDLNSSNITGTGNVNITGNVSLTGTVDGRDVAADGTKLDAIEPLATADQTGAEIKTAYEAEANTNAFTDAEQTKLASLDPLADETTTANVTAAGALMDTEVTNLAEVKAFSSADYATAAQGATADSAISVANAALPKAGGALTGAVTTTSTIDGRDIAADGTKLDGIEAGADVTNTTNVTAAGALMDSEVANLAEVKAFSSADYATAAQGTNADSALSVANAALPKAGGALTGAVTTTSTIDGRDVAADGSKLDGIEVGATADQTASEIRTLVGSATDSNVFTDADHSKLDGIEPFATADQTASQIRALVEAATDSNVFTDADHSKLDSLGGSVADVYVNVQDFGATGDGSDQTTEIQNAINYASTRNKLTVFFPDGHYKFSTLYFHHDPVLNPQFQGQTITDGNGSNKVFPWTWYVESGDDLQVRKGTSDANLKFNNPLVEGVDYTITTGLGSDTGGTLTLTTAPASNERVRVSSGRRDGRIRVLGTGPVSANDLLYYSAPTATDRIYGSFLETTNQGFRVEPDGSFGANGIDTHTDARGFRMEQISLIGDTTHPLVYAEACPFFNMESCRLRQLNDNGDGMFVANAWFFTMHNSTVSGTGATSNGSALRGDAIASESGGFGGLYTFHNSALDRSKYGFHWEGGKFSNVSFHDCAIQGNNTYGIYASAGALEQLQLDNTYFEKQAGVVLTSFIKAVDNGIEKLDMQSCFLLGGGTDGSGEASNATTGPMIDLDEPTTIAIDNTRIFRGVQDFLYVDHVQGGLKSLGHITNTSFINDASQYNNVTTPAYLFRSNQGTPPATKSKAPVPRMDNNILPGLKGTLNATAPYRLYDFTAEASPVVSDPAAGANTIPKIGFGTRATTDLAPKVPDEPYSVYTSVGAQTVQNFVATAVGVRVKLPNDDRVAEGRIFMISNDSSSTQDLPVDNANSPFGNLVTLKPSESCILIHCYEAGVLRYRLVTHMQTPSSSYTLPEATATTRGGIELYSNTDQSVAANAVSSTAGRTYGVQLNSSGQAVVNVPWSNTNTVYTHPAYTARSLNTSGAQVLDVLTTDTIGSVTNATTRTMTLADLGYTGATNANNYSLPLATNSVRGGIELYSNTDQSVAANSVTSTAGRTYGIQLNSANQAVVNVPWTDTNTTYTAGTNLALSGTTFNMATGGIGAGTYGNTSNGVKIDTITVDDYGRVTEVVTGATGDVIGVTAGIGLSGGGTSGTIPLAVALSELTDMTQTMVGSDEFIVLDNGSDRRKRADEIGLSVFNNDAGFTSNTGDITGVTAGDGLSGGSTSGNASLAVDSTVARSTGDTFTGQINLQYSAPELRFTDTTSSAAYSAITYDSNEFIINADKGNSGSGTHLRLKVDAIQHVTMDGLTRMGIHCDYNGNGGLTIDSGFSGALTSRLSYNRAFSSASSEVMRFRNNGSNVGVVSYTNALVTYGTGSDVRLKTNIKDAPSASMDIDAIRVVSFDWKSDGSSQKYGFIAQELVEVAPVAVYVPEDEEEMLNVDYGKLVPMLVKEVQELRARVAELENK